MKSEILKHFEDMEDHRVAGRVVHPLRNIIFITVVGALCGLTGWEEIADFAKYRKGFFSKYIDISMGLPCEDTLRRDADLSFRKLPCCAEITTEESDHGRVEVRRYRFIDDLSLLLTGLRWKGLRMIVR